MMTMAAYDRAVKASEAAALANPAPAPIVAPAVVRVSALDWASDILGRYLAVADERQIAHARYLMADESLSGLRITPVGASYAELEARLEALNAPKPSPAPKPAPKPTPKPSPKPSPAAAKLTITIKGTDYDVQPVPAGEFGTRAFRLSKLAGKGEVYDVIRDNDGLVACDCPSYEVTFKGTCDTCKHGKALVAMGLLDAPAWSAPAEVETPPAPELPPADAPLPAWALPIGPSALASIITARPGDRTIGDDVREAEALAPSGPPVCPECGEVHPADGDHESDPETWEGEWADEAFTTSDDSGPSHGFADELADAVAVNDAAIADADAIGWEKPARRSYFLAPTPKPAKAPALPDGRYLLHEIVDGTAAHLRGVGSPIHDLMADRLAALAAEIRNTGAQCVREFEERLPIMEADLRERLLYDAFNDGFRQGEQQTMADVLSR